MKIAFISDIHSNIHALDLVLDDISKHNVDKIICLGDLVVKYLYPKEVLNLIQKNCDIVIKGNCDDLVVKDKNYKFARGQIGIDGIDYINNLPVTYQLKLNKILLNMYHSNPNDLDSIFNPLFKDNKPSKLKPIIKDYNKMFINNEKQIVIVGHTHQAYLSYEQNNKLKLASDNLILSNNDKSIINIGSVGDNDYMYNLGNKEYIPRLKSYINYAILEEINDNFLKASIIKIDYKEELLKVYFDFINNKNNNKSSVMLYYQNKMYNSLIDMGYDEKILKLNK